MGKTFAQTLRSIVPGWLSDGEGGSVLSAVGGMMDGASARARGSLEARFPSRAPADALQFMARDRKLVRGINEPPAAFAARLLRYLDDHRVRGNPFALMAQLRAYCQCAVRIRTVDNSGNWFTLDRDGSRSIVLGADNWDWDDRPVPWARFWVIIYPTSDGQPWSRCGKWGSAGLYGSGRFDSETATIGTTATRDQVAAVRSIVRTWKPAGTMCVAIIVAFSDGSFAPDATSGLPDGTWGQWGKDSGSGMVPVRLETARYWSAT